MAAFNANKAVERNDWSSEVEAEHFAKDNPERVSKGRKPTSRSKSFRQNGFKKPESVVVRRPPTIQDPAEVFPSLPKATKEVLRDEPLWAEGPYTGTQPIQRIYSQNLDFSTFPLLCERVYADLEAENPRLRREVPFCAFQHVQTSVLNAVLIDHIRTVNAEDRYADEESPLNLIPDDLVTPGPIAEFMKLVANTTTPQGDLVKVNIPEIGIPQGSVNDIPSGSFGMVGEADHNKYECYVSPYVTSRLVEETIRQNDERRFTPWNPLPQGAYPEGCVPNTNLLGYRLVERLNPEGMQAIANIVFPNSDDMSGRLRWSPELVGRVSAHLKKLDTRYKMHVGKPVHGTNSAAVGWTEVQVAGVNNLQHNTNRISTINGPVRSSIALGSSQCNIVGIAGLKRKRTALARGLCYTRANGNAPEGWNAHINDNFTMVGEFTPLIGSDLPALRIARHENASPSGDRGLVISTWTRRNFLIQKT